MLNVFRQRQTLVKALFGVILFLVAISMVITLIPGMTGDAGDSANPVVAQVGGERITQFDVQNAIQQVSQRNRVPPEMMPFYTSQILNELILEKASLQEAERLGLRVDQSDVVEQLRRDPAVFPNGQFVGIQQYEDLVFQTYGTSVAQFEERFRRGMLMSKLRQLVTDPVFVTPEEVHKAFVEQNEKVILDYVALNPTDFAKDIKPDDSTIAEYYKASKDRYQVPEKRLVKVLLFEKALFREAKISDQEFKKYYQDRQDNYRTPERVTVRHILIKADTKDPAQVEQARKKADDLLKKLKGGADFATLAKQNSDDKATAVNGGLLANIVRKQTVPEFEKAAFSLPANQISEPVQTVYGIHIIQGVSHEQAHVQPLEEVKAQIEAELVNEKADKAVADAADQAARALARSPADFNAIAEKYRGQVVTPPAFAQNENVPRIGMSAAFMQEVFGLAKDRAGQAIQVVDGYAVPLLQDVIAPHQGELAEVREQVQSDYIAEQSKIKAIGKASELAKLLLEQSGTKDIKKAAKSLKLEVKTSPAITRDGSIPSLGTVRDLDPKLFTMPVGATAGPVSLSGTQVVYQIASREPAQEQEFASKKAQIQEQLLNEKRRIAFDIFQENLKKKMVASGDLKLNQDLIARLTSPTARP